MRQIDSMLYERLALSRDKASVLALSKKGHEVQDPADLIKDPYLLKFTGLPEREYFRESDLEQALIDKLQKARRMLECKQEGKDDTIE